MDKFKASAIGETLAFGVTGGTAGHFLLSSDRGDIIIGMVIGLLACFFLSALLHDYTRTE